MHSITHSPKNHQLTESARARAFSWYLAKVSSCGRADWDSPASSTMHWAQTTNHGNGGFLYFSHNGQLALSPKNQDMNKIRKSKNQKIKTPSAQCIEEPSENQKGCESSNIFGCKVSSNSKTNYRTIKNREWRYGTWKMETYIYIYYIDIYIYIYIDI